ncbi:MAG: ABC transporter permease [Gemmatimonadota bacterium]|nr:MAG: ABC transporter permease [Gemmatimonadota bacterium]
MPLSLINWRQVWVLYRRELRGALRERSIVVNSFLLPVFLYPVLLWLTFSAMVFVEGLSEGRVSRIVLLDLPAEHAELRDSLSAAQSVEVREDTVSVEQGVAWVLDGELDAVAEFLAPGPEAEALPDNFAVRISYDRAEERSRRASDRIESAVTGYRDRWLEREARDLRVSREQLEGFLIYRNNVATERQVGAFLLSLMVPLFVVIMVALGCFVPSIDTTAGERERSTWETLMSVSASRMSVVTSKYLYVATLGLAAGMLNVTAMVISIGAVLRPLAGELAEELQFRIPLLAVPVLLIGALALALFFAAAMMLLASFARKFKDGQAMITPVYWLALIPVFLSGTPELHLTPTLATVPIANVAVMMRDAINGRFDWLLIGESLLVQMVFVVLILWLARAVLRFEDYLLGSFDGSFWRFARQRLLARRSSDALPVE